jgi:Spy/CpxP family protein refolding chaperone
MRIQKRHLWKWALILATLCCTLMVAVLAFGQDQPPQQNQPSPAMRMRPQAQGFGMMPGNQGPGMRGPFGPGMMRGNRDAGQGNYIANLLRPDVQKELAITAEQRQKLDDIRFTEEKETIQNRSALQIHRMELSRLSDAENPDRTAIDKKIQEIAQDEAALMRSSITGRLNARNVLTAEQRSKLAQFMRNRGRAGRTQAAGGAWRPRQPAGNAAPGREKLPLPAAPANPKAE